MADIINQTLDLCFWDRKVGPLGFQVCPDWVSSVGGGGWAVAFAGVAFAGVAFAGVAFAGVAFAGVAFAGVGVGVTA
jgi:hypothetical protein